MRAPLYVRGLSDGERNRLEAGLHSKEAFVLRRCQILLLSAQRHRAAHIAKLVGCGDQMVLDVIHRFEQEGLEAVLTRGSNRPHHHATKFAPQAGERLREMVHESPRAFGKATSLWTLQLVAEVSFEQGLTKERVSTEAVRLALRRLGVRWRKAKGWLTSPDPEYGRKRGRASA